MAELKDSANKMQRGECIVFDFASIPEKPPRSISLLDGLKYRAALDKSMLFLIVFVVMMVGFFAAVMFFSMEKSFRLPFVEMEQTDGTVVELVENSKCNERTVSIQYQFVTKTNRTYYGKQATKGENVYSTLKRGDVLPIIYDPKDPTFNGIEGEMGKNEPPVFIFILLPLFFLLIFIPMFLPNIKQIRAARSVFKKGIVTRGEIVFIGRKKMAHAFNTDMHTNLNVFYRFATLTGEVVEAKFNTDNDWLANKFTIGSPVTVSYMEKKPKKSIVLDFYYR